MALSKKERFFIERVMNWGPKNKRNFVWREKNDDFFIVFVSEFLLRKTKSETVDKFLRNVFLKMYRSFCDIASEDEKKLKDVLKPLGLHNQRAVALKEIASILCERDFLPSYEEILNFPHCGRYIANAVECFFYKKRKPIVDHNIQRVFNRFFSIPKAIEIHKADYLWDFAERLLPIENYINYNYHILDLSALICKPRKPQCTLCPLARECDFYLQIQSSNGGGKFHV